MERSVFCAKGNGSCRRLWAEESPASGNITPAALGRMGRRAHVEGSRGEALRVTWGPC